MGSRLGTGIKGEGKKYGYLTKAEGKADVAFASAMAPAAVEAEAGPHGIRWLELPIEDREGYKRALVHRPTMVPGKIKGWVKSAIGINSFIAPFCTFVRADLVIN